MGTASAVPRSCGAGWPQYTAPPMYGFPPQSPGELLGGVPLAWQFPINAFPGTPLGSFTGSSSRESQLHLLQWTWISVLGWGVEGDDRLFRICSFLVCSLSALNGCPCICYSSILDSCFYSFLATPHYSNSLFLVSFLTTSPIYILTTFLIYFLTLFLVSFLTTFLISFLTTSPISFFFIISILKLLWCCVFD